MKLKLFLIASLLFVTCANAQVSLSQASTLKQQIDTMCSDFTDTLVCPTAQNDALILISMKVLQNDKSVGLWMLISSAAVAKSDVNVREIWFSDIAAMRGTAPYAMVLPVSVAKSVQSRLYDGKVSLEDGISEIRRSLTKKVVKR